MTFSSGGFDQRWFRDDLKYVTAENLQTALEFVDSINADGGKGYSMSNAGNKFEDDINNIRDFSEFEEIRIVFPGDLQILHCDP